MAARLAVATLSIALIAAASTPAAAPRTLAPAPVETAIEASVEALTGTAPRPTLDLSSAAFGADQPDWSVVGPTYRTFRVAVDFPAIGAHASRDWAPMLAWRSRALTASRERREPIADVRCMGLSPVEIATRADRFAAPILSVAIEHGISASLLNAVITEESCFDPDARSRVGAIGLMQLMPDTARWLGVDDATDPLQNLDAGARYLATLIDEFETLELALAAYNAGPGTVRRAGGVPNYAETRGYLQRVLGHYRRYAAAARHESSPPRAMRTASAS